MPSMQQPPQAHSRYAPLPAEEQAKKKWDLLLSAINTVSKEPPRVSPRRQRAQMAEASREIATEQGAPGTLATPASARTERKAWDPRHHVVFSTVNDKLQKNVRSYFDRPREIESFGERHDPPMRTSWYLDSNITEGVSNPTISTAPPPSSLARSVSSPDMVTVVNIERGSSLNDSQRKWNPRHHVVFNKDNPKIPKAHRDYFERPRPIMW